ncbi:MAG: preprotein translocase subunit SecG [Candidatus Liptonbacteria bacterium RIFCSPLOWO2_01_FULL_56_20]|uniref:Protein-export membrane protein SecG n=1 Tax=Candidatus Liptonbacteria bacterium RIFCSPLOWO2_01_FULL_56_20 TaxID=1798652 RepID=A0A1G2CJB9_9BACT|nr:MAG: Preprotein translocase, SecG subunit [Parcubacteria group bacterium GW2011_GWB1_56_8]OGY98273.1 MAG: preprotein translocase subunit SecG [Candidatus Liptonbacteria bacterium RIFCSPHIGHO2_01_FULL_56_18b]OGZ00830.1 MAG: preprotein translocase subunit SecG [Candidatus Liptonbacteria bacterium RIFCSPLOWO2_01_FULL_56_20]
MIIPITQVVVSVLLIVLILLQERSAGLSGIFGGESGGFYQTRRGMEKLIFWGTIVLAVVFMGLAVMQLIL